MVAATFQEEMSISQTETVRQGNSPSPPCLPSIREHHLLPVRHRTLVISQALNK